MRKTRWIWSLCQVLQQKNLTNRKLSSDNASMKTNPKTVAPGTAEAVRNRIEAGGERVWRLADFEGMAFMAVAQTLSRLARKGEIQRLGKGLYYRSRPTAFGQSRPNTAQIRGLPIRQRKAFPAGIGAANLLGFTTQNPARIELATNGSSLPRAQ